MALHADDRHPPEDPVERQVFAELAKEKWDFRTAEGISEETGIPVDYIREILQLRSDLVREALVPDEEGRTLYRLRSRGAGPRERLAEARAFLVKTFN